MQISGAGALVVGGASGLGEATSRRLHAEGAHVTIADVNAEKGDALAGELGERALFVPADVTKPTSCRPRSTRRPSPPSAACASRCSARASAGRSAR